MTAEPDASVLVVKLGRRLAQGAMDCCLEAGASAVSQADEIDGHISLTVYADSSQLEHVAQALGIYHRRWAPEEAFTCDRSQLTEDWRLAWTEHLEAVQLTPRLRLVPLNAKYRHLEPSQHDLQLEAGLVFGFGEHPTTRLASVWLEAHAAGVSVLDIGTGTGVLALVAERAGAASVCGIDIDEESVAVAARNAQRNHIQRCHFSSTRLEDVSQDFDVVVANVDALTLTRLAQAVVARVRQGGALALTGILEEQMHDVLCAYADAGINLQPVGLEAGWVLLATRAAV